MTGRPGSTGIVHVVVGPAGHGVVRHATTLLGTAALAADGVYRADCARGLADLPQRWRERTGRRPDLLHLHLTDHLLAPDAAGCADLVLALSRTCPVSLTLHDLPQPADGPGRYERRAAAYRAMADAAVGVVVASEHERSLLLACPPGAGSGPVTGPVEVVPLPLGPGGVGPLRDRPLADADLVVFGYLYPGKGHLEAIAAAARLAGAGGRPDVRPGVLALGRVSPGHEHLPAEYRERAARLGVRFTVSGHVPDDRVDERLRASGVPVAPRRDVSASGSIGSWLRAGRRPLTPAGPYTDDLEARCPGALLRYGPGTDHPTLADAARAALHEPELTWLSAGTHLGPDAARCGDLYARHLRHWAARAREILT